MTCDVGTISGLVMLTELLISDTSGVTKLVGFKLLTSKDGDYLADQLINIMDENLGILNFIFLLLPPSQNFFKVSKYGMWT